MPDLPPLPDLASTPFGQGMPTLDVLQTYLVVLNVASLLLHAVHFIVLRRTGQERVGEPIRNLLTLAGGVGGTLVTYVLWDRRTTKQNAWPHIATVIAAIGWGVALGFIYVHPLSLDALLQGLRRPHDMRIGYYLAAVSAVALVAFGIDKWRATRDAWRIPEAVLLAFAVAGGTPGAIVGMLLFRHKIRSTQFALGLPLLLCAQLALALYLLNAGLV